MTAASHDNESLEVGATLQVSPVTVQSIRSSLIQQLRWWWWAIRDRSYGSTSFTMLAGPGNSAEKPPALLVAGACHVLGPNAMAEKIIAGHFDESFGFRAGFAAAECLSRPLNITFFAAPGPAQPSPRWLPRVAEIAAELHPKVVVLHAGAIDFLPGLVYRLIRSAPTVVRERVGRIAMDGGLEWFSIQNGYGYSIHRPRYNLLGRVIPLTPMRLYRRSLSRTIGRIQALGCKVIVIGPFSRPTELMLPLMRRYNLATGEVAVRLRAEYVDAMAVLSGHPDSIYDDDAHLSAAGHQILSEALSPVLEKVFRQQS